MYSVSNISKAFSNNGSCWREFLLKNVDLVDYSGIDGSR